MKINNIRPCQNQNFKARLVKTKALDILLDKISTGYSRNDAAKLCKKVRNLKPDSLTIQMPEMISGYKGRKVVLEILYKDNKIGSYVMPVSESRSEIMSANKIFKQIKQIIGSCKTESFNDKLISLLYPQKVKANNFQELTGLKKPHIISYNTDVMFTK